MISAITFIFSILLLFGATMAHSSDNVMLEPINVIATPITISSDGIDPSRPTSVPKSATTLEEVITHETIEALNPSDIFDLMQYASSVFIQRQGRKAPSWVKVRGNRALGIIIDGVYIPADVTSRILAMLPVESIERIRIVRDSTSLNLGPLPNGTSNLLGGDDGGYLVIETRHPSKTLEGMAVLQTESYDRWHTSAMSGTMGEKGYLNLIADYDTSNGDPDWTTGFEKRSLYGKGGLFMGKWVLDINSFLSDSSKELQRSTTPGVSDAKWEYDPMKISEVSTKLSYNWNNGVTSFSYAHSYLDSELQIEKWSNPVFHSTESQKENFNHIRLDHSQHLGSHTLRTGVEGIRWHTPTGEYYYTGWEKKEHTGGFFVQDEWGYGDFSFDAGARIDKTWIDVGYEQIGNKKIRIEDESLDPVIALTLGNRWNYTKKEAFYLRTRFSTQNNPSVETIDGGKLSSSKRLGFEGGWESKRFPILQPRVSIYYLDVNNAPYVAGQHPDPENLLKLINVYDGKSWIEYGAELALAGVVGGWSYQLSYSYNRNNDDTLDNRVPHSTFNGIVRYCYKRYEAALGIYYIDSFESVNMAGIGDAGSYTNIDLTVGYSFKFASLDNKVQIYTRNITDDDYESVYGFPSMGRIIGVTYRLTF